jgi:hypothetical protein
MQAVLYKLTGMALATRDATRLVDAICHQDLTKYSPTVIVYPNRISLKLASTHAMLVVMYGGKSYKIRSNRREGVENLPLLVRKRAVDWLEKLADINHVHTAIARGLTMRWNQINEACEVAVESLTHPVSLVSVACQIYLVKRNLAAIKAGDAMGTPKQHWNMTLHRMLVRDTNWSRV